MAHTEEQAREKWCPEQHASAVAIIARGGEPATADVKSRCIASGCMMWVKTATDEEFSEAACHRDYVALKSMGRCGLAR